MTCPDCEVHCARVNELETRMRKIFALANRRPQDYVDAVARIAVEAETALGMPPEPADDL